MRLREANKVSIGASYSYADLTVVSLSSAQNQLGIMIALVEAAHQDVSSWRAAHDENAVEITRKKAALTRGGCG